MRKLVLKHKGFPEAKDVDWFCNHYIEITQIQSITYNEHIRAYVLFYWEEIEE